MTEQIVVWAEDIRIQPHTLGNDVYVSQETIEGIHANQLYLPSIYLTKTIDRSYKAYFELESSLFFQRFATQMNVDQSSKGIIRLQRKIHSLKRQYVLIEDIMTLESLFGELEAYHVLHSTKTSATRYIIVTLLFKNRTMAHVELHITNKEELNLEWNGIHNLVVFNSEDMNSLSTDYAAAPFPFALQLSYELVEKNAHHTTEEMVAAYKRWVAIVKEAE